MQIFMDWVKNKIKLHQKTKFWRFKEREIFWCALGYNIGFEENGKNQNFSRPVLIVRKFSQNLFWGVPLSSQIKEGPYYTNFSFQGKPQSVLISHLRAMDSKRLYSKIGQLGHRDFEKVINSIHDCIPNSKTFP